MPKEVEGLLQLAGGVLVGGLAMYRLSGGNTPDNSPTKTRPRSSSQSNKIPTKAEYAQQIIDNSRDEPLKVGKVIVEHKQQRQAPVDEDTPSWMSSKDPQTNQHYDSSDAEWLSRREDSASSFEEPQQQHNNQGHVKRAAAAIEAKNIRVETEEDARTEEVDTPSWMSQKDPCHNIDEVLETRKEYRSSSLKALQVASARESVSGVAHQFSDVVFVYPVTGDAYLGQGLATGAIDKNTKNVHGHSVQVKVMETRAGAGGAVVGALSAGTQATVLTSSKGLRLMLPNMFQIVAHDLPTVFHVATSSVGEDLSIRPSLEDLAIVRDTGFALLGSKTSQEAHDMAVIAHVAAKQSNTPFLHFFDGVRTLNQVEKISVASGVALKEGLGAVEKSSQGRSPSPTSVAGFEQAASDDCPYVATVVEQVMKQLEDTLGKRYKIFEYFGDAEADSLVVTMSAPANVLEEAVHRYGKNGKVGVLVVRLLRPWSAAHFLAAVPKTVRRVCVLDQSGNLRPLFQDVAASFHSTAAWVTPLLVGGKINCAPGEEFTPADAVAVFNNLNSDSPRPNFVVGDVFSVNSLRTEKTIARNIANADVKELVHFTSDETCSFDFAVASILGSKAGLNIKQNSARDRYLGDHGVSRHDLRFGSGDIPAEYSVLASDAIVCDEASLHSKLNVLANAKERSLLFVVSAKKGVNGLNSLPMSLKNLISRKGIKLFMVDAVTVEEELNVPGVADWLAGCAALEHVDSTTYHSIVPYLKQAFRQAFADQSHETLNQLCDMITPQHLHAILTKVDAPSFGALDIATPRSFAGGFSDNFDTQSWASASTFNDVNKFDEFEPFVPRVSSYKSSASTSASADKDGKAFVPKQHQISWNLIFKEAYDTQQALRPAVNHVYQVKLTSRKRLTPETYSRNIFHLEFDISGTGLKYEIGDALGVFGHNDKDEVEEFLDLMGWDGDMFVTLPSHGQMPPRTTEAMTLRNMFTQYLDLFGRPSKKFYIALAQFAESRYEHLKLMHTGTDDAEAFKLGIHETVTYVDLMRQYKTARPTVEEFIALIPEIKPRHYSIASSMKLNPKSVHLLVVAVDWKTPLGKKRYGQCTRYLANMDPDKEECLVTVDICPSVLRLPPTPQQPIVMAGLGTGMAPFRAFVQERKYQREMGLDVGPIVLYFGARHRHEEYLYGDEWDEYFKEGLVTRLGLAFSRDQDKKVYIQHKIEEDGALLKEYLYERNGSFYLCGPTWPVPDVRDAIAKGISPEKAQDGIIDTEVVEQLKSEGRYVLEVY